MRIVWENKIFFITKENTFFILYKKAIEPVMLRFATTKEQLIEELK